MFGIGVAGVGGEEWCAVAAGEGGGEVLGGEVEEGVVGTDVGPVVAGADGVEGEGDVGECVVGVEVRGDDYGQRIAEAGESELVVGGGLDGAVLGGGGGHVLVGELGGDGVVRFAEVEVLPGGLGGG